MHDGRPRDPERMPGPGHEAASPHDPRYAEVRDVFLEALDVEPGARASFITDRCGDDADLSRRVLRLLTMLEADADDLAPIVGTEELLRLIGFTEDGCIGRYRLVGMLGRGGMGVVYLARDDESGDEVALKFLRPGLGSARLQERFAREIAILSRLSHPLISRYLDSGVIATVLGEMPYLVMEYVAGQPLGEHVERTSPDRMTRIRLAAEICESLAHAHERGVVHRDLKPSNIIIDHAGRPHLVDFGVAATIRNSLGMSMTQFTDAVIGTVDYMAPEQIHDTFGAMDSRTDVFAMGVVLHELLTGVRPFGRPGQAAPRVLASILMDSPPSLGKLDGVSVPELELIVAKCLAKRPSARYPDAGVLAEDLRRYLVGRDGLVGLAHGRARFHWRWKRSTAALRARRFVLAAALLPLLFVLGSIVSKQGSGEAAARRQEKLGRVFTRLEEATRIIHVEPRTPESLRRSIEVLTDVRTELAGLGNSPPGPALERFTRWRLGEAHYFLGGRSDDPILIWRAMTEFEAAGVDLGADALSGLDPASDLYEQLSLVSSSVARAGAAAALESLSGIDRPVVHLQGAYMQRWASLGLPTTRDDPVAVLMARQTPDPTSYLDFGRILVLRGICREDTLDLRRGLELLDRVDDDALWQNIDWRAQSWFEESCGLARRALGEMTGRPGLIAASFPRFERSLRIRGVNGGRLRFAGTVLELGMAKSAAARMATDPVLRQCSFEEAVAHGLQALDLLADEASAVASSLAAEVLIRASVGNALTGGGTDLLDLCRPALEAARSRIDPSRHPLPAARSYLAEATLIRARSLLNGEVEPPSRTAELQAKAEGLQTAEMCPPLWTAWRFDQRALDDWRAVESGPESAGSPGGSRQPR